MAVPSFIIRVNESFSESICLFSLLNEPMTRKKIH